MHEHPIRGFFESRLEAILAELKELVEHESPSRERGPLTALAALVANRWRSLGGQVELESGTDGGVHVVGRFAGGSERRPALVIGHFDTVWPIGTLERLPVRREAGWLFGPGVFDMKASLAMLNGVL